MATKIKPHIKLKSVSTLNNDLKKVVYSATFSENEYDYFIKAFEKISPHQIQKVLDHWFDYGLIKIGERDVLKNIEIEVNHDG